MNQNSLIEWVQDIFKKNYKQVRVDYENSSEKIDGYIGEVNFMTVQCLTLEGKTDIIHVVVKTGKKNLVYRKLANTEQLFKREIDIYQTIFPLFNRFRKDRGVTRTLSIPKCYATAVGKDTEIILLENLKSADYNMNDRKTPFSSEHLKIVLKFYAEFHATSLAMNDQKCIDFENIVKNLDDMLRLHLSGPMLSITKMMLKNISEVLLDRKEMELHLKVTKLIEEDKFEDVFKFFDCELPYRVISHGDAWNNNIMFKYKDNGKIPDKACVLDWQMASVRNSPVFDILQLLYCNCSPDDLSRNWENYLEIYHNFLSEFLIQLGSDPHIFSFSTLLKHWNQFSLFGLLFVPMVMKLMFLETEDVDGLDEAEDTEGAKRQFVETVIRDENYYERIFGLFKFYFDQVSN